MKILIPFSLTLVFTVFSSCTRTANKTGPLVPYPEVTADIDIGEQVRGEGTRAELLGFIRWGDPGRATFTARKQEHELGGAVVKQSMQSAVYDALGGQPDHFIVDPHFHTVEHNFLVFKTAKTSVVGRKRSTITTDRSKNTTLMVRRLCYWRTLLKQSRSIEMAVRLRSWLLPVTLRIV